MATPTPKTHTQWKLFILPITILILIVTGLFVIKLVHYIPSSHFETSIDVSPGQTLPDFFLTEQSGKRLKVSEIQAKVILINFWASWCEACTEEMPSIVKLRNTMHEEGFEVIAINLDENPETMIPRAAKQFKIEFPLYKDSDGTIAELFDVHAIPLTVVINKNRTILSVRSGEYNWNSHEWREQLKKWLSE